MAMRSSCRPGASSIGWCGRAEVSLWRRGTRKHSAQMTEDARRTRRWFGEAARPSSTLKFSSRPRRDSAAICVFCVHLLSSALRFSASRWRRWSAAINRTSPVRQGKLLRYGAPYGARCGRTAVLRASVVETACFSVRMESALSTHVGRHVSADEDKPGHNIGTVARGFVTKGREPKLRSVILTAAWYNLN